MNCPFGVYVCPSFVVSMGLGEINVHVLHSGLLHGKVPDGGSGVNLLFTSRFLRLGGCLKEIIGRLGKRVCVVVSSSRMGCKSLAIFRSIVAREL